MTEPTGRSLKLSTEDLAKANSALSKLGSKADLAATLRMSRTTINKFFKGEPVQRKQFHAICKKLKLDWQPSPAQKPGFLPPRSTEPEISGRTPVSQDSAIAQLVQEVRSRLYPIITDPTGSIGTLRVLGVNRPVLVDSQIYIDLNVLERLSGEWQFAQWQQEYKPGDRDLFDRLGVGRIEQERVEAISTIVKSPRLLVLGKPGSGKTTLDLLQISFCRASKSNEI